MKVSLMMAERQTPVMPARAEMAQTSMGLRADAPTFYRNSKTLDFTPKH
ncbi:hypothetical protein GAO09_21630 [Rhizobiales bacterium RZME27]|jgi:hypothetical protein|uniref:Uncharacterized protein n=1 Tax=Endobacterium cereale TaxID=2663029 RepID=A0A6A8AIL7_9HYPH|nr:hypothetical protein [Endobacterium cereale]MEB2844228.1 hypothetical protein [Endobacterium cereale]MQY48641.1 hypothetical protein [Endobacterium cereale]